ncbi:MAG: type II toxin-antitoxin system YafQ family toxin [Symploca sp. SIO2G7]|nr:type II toxin-antitoxin system YafQ family toxin [Symploca sp. SIO2G7]
MRKLKPTKQFKKDVKRVQKRGKDIAKLKAVIQKLQANETLDPSYKDHPLIGNWKPARDCHIEPDWLLLYDISNEELLTLLRTGSHSDLFK